MNPELECTQSLPGSVGVLWLRCETCRAGDNCHHLVDAGKSSLLLRFVFDTFMMYVRAQLLCPVR